MYIDRVLLRQHHLVLLSRKLLWEFFWCWSFNLGNLGIFGCCWLDLDRLGNGGISGNLGHFGLWCSLGYLHIPNLWAIEGWSLSQVAVLSFLFGIFIFKRGWSESKLLILDKSVLCWLTNLIVYHIYVPHRESCVASVYQIVHIYITRRTLYKCSCIRIFKTISFCSELPVQRS